MILFLAGVGTKAGYGFASTFANGGLTLFFAGAVITCLTAVGTMLIGYKVLKIPMSLLSGILAGLQTQPAVPAFASEQSGTELPNLGYATVYPVATISKILIAQLLLALLKRAPCRVGGRTEVGRRTDQPAGYDDVDWRFGMPCATR